MERTTPEYEPSAAIPGVVPPGNKVGERVDGSPLYLPTHMPSDERLEGIARGLAKFGLVHTPQAAISEAAAIERAWQHLAAMTEVPLPDSVVALVQRRTHRMLERWKSKSIKRPTKSPERYAVDEVYHELVEGNLKYRDGMISR